MSLSFFLKDPLDLRYSPHASMHVTVAPSSRSADSVSTCIYGGVSICRVLVIMMMWGGVGWQRALNLVLVWVGSDFAVGELWQK